MQDNLRGGGEECVTCAGLPEQEQEEEWQKEEE